MLAVITPFTVIGGGMFILFCIFILIPWIWKKLLPVEEDETSSDIISGIKDGMHDLSDKSKKVAEEIKEKTAESQVIKDFLKKD